MTTATETAASDVFQALRNRRSIYGLNKQSPIPDKQIQELIEETIKHTPSAFNSQTTRIILLLHKEHDKLWDITTEILRAAVPANQFEPTEQKMQGFKSAYGTVMFFEDQAIVESLQKQFALYQDRFPVWSEHTSAMHQIVIWMALEAEGFGANLQHYNPLIDEKVKAQWKIPENWKLIAQMPFGEPTMQPQDKEFQPLESRFKVFA